MEASAGVAEVFDRPAREARSETGYLTQSFSLYPDLTVAENLRYAGDLRRVPRDAIAERGGRYLEMFDLSRFVDRLAGRLSGGMKQKLSLACALVAEPRVLLLDEPTTGVDPVSRREFWDALAHLAAGGLTVLVATPYLDEAERCRRVALIHQGELRQVGTPGRATPGPRRPARRSPHGTIWPRPSACCRRSRAPTRRSSTSSASVTVWTSSPRTPTERRTVSGASLAAAGLRVRGHPRRRAESRERFRGEPASAGRGAGARSVPGATHAHRPARSGRHRRHAA